MSLPVLFGCSDKKEPVVTTAAADETTAAVTESPYDENGYLLDSLPDDLAYTGKTVSLLHWSDAPFVDFSSELSADVVASAVYARNQLVEDRHGITIDFIGIPGNNSNKDSYVNTVKGSILGGTGDFDLLATHSLVGQGMVLENLLLDLNDTEYHDFDKPWWPAQLTEAASVRGKLYFASGDISTNMLWYMTVMFYNVDLAQKYSIEDLHDVVLNGKWTLEKFEQVVKNTYLESNGDGIKNVGDTYGFYSPKTPLDTFLYGCGITVITHDEAGNPVISPEFGSEKTVNVLKDLCSLMFNTNDAMTTTENYDVNFSNGEFMLYFNYAHNAASKFKDVKFNFSVLPAPKYDENQENYVTTESFSYSIYMIPTDAKDKDMSSAVMEALASAGYRTTTPAVFETSLKTKYALNSKTAMVYDIIKSNICFDLGRMYGANLDNLTHVAFRNALGSNQSDWASTYAGLKDMLAKKLADLFPKT